jgi:hypothetical protein
MTITPVRGVLEELVGTTLRSSWTSNTPSQVRLSITTFVRSKPERCWICLPTAGGKSTRTTALRHSLAETTPEVQGRSAISHLSELRQMS